MFDALAEKLSSVFSKITSRGVLSENDIDEAMREIRLALIEADVSLPVIKDFIAKVKVQALGEKVVKSITPGQMIIKIVHDELENLLGSGDCQLNLNAPSPLCIMMLGLQGSGKTTSAAKIANKLKKNKKVLLASLDVYRPAAQEQLEILAKQIGVESLPIISKEKPCDIAKRALEYAKKCGFDVVILDTAGRLQIDENLMQEVMDIRELVHPVENLLVADALMGQEACAVADSFNKSVGITGIVLTRIDGTSRAGAALSMKMVANAPIKFLGTGEKIDDFEEFHPDRLAGRILGQGDVVSLVERTIERVNQQEAEAVAKKMMRGHFDLNDMLSQFQQMKKLGDMGSILSMLPGFAKIKSQINDAQMKMGNDLMKKQEAIILSMTKYERKNPDVIKAARKRRIALGAGVEVHEVNKLLKIYEQMSATMKKLGNMGPLSALASRFMQKNPMGGFPFGGKTGFPF